MSDEMQSKSGSVGKGIVWMFFYP